jgi:hypothetical protein
MSCFVRIFSDFILKNQYNVLHVYLSFVNSKKTFSMSTSNVAPQLEIQRYLRETIQSELYLIKTLISNLVHTMSES